MRRCACLLLGNAQQLWGHFRQFYSSTSLSIVQDEAWQGIALRFLRELVNEFQQALRRRKGRHCAPALLAFELGSGLIFGEVGRLSACSKSPGSML